MNQQPFRIPPAGPAHAYQTFEIKAPRGPEFVRAATCEEAGCLAWRNGWVTRVPQGSPDLIEAIRNSGRSPMSVDDFEAELVFTFAPGTECFRSSTHTKSVRPDLPQLFVVRDGDWRGNPTGARRVHQRPEDWVENFQESTAVVIDQIKKG